MKGMYFFIFYPTAIACFRRCGRWRCLSYPVNLKAMPDPNNENVFLKADIALRKLISINLKPKKKLSNFCVK